MKRIFAFLSVFVLLISSMVIPVSAATSTIQDFGTFNISYLSSTDIEFLNTVVSGKVPYYVLYSRVPSSVPNTFSSLHILTNPSIVDFSSFNAIFPGTSVYDDYARFHIVGGKAFTLNLNEYRVSSVSSYNYSPLFIPESFPHRGLGFSYFFETPFLNGNSYSYSLATKTYGTISFPDYFDTNGYKFSFSNGTSLVYDPSLNPKVTDLTIKTPPTKTSYKEGETLNLSGFSVTVSKSNGTSLDVPFADFGANNITVAPSNGSALILTDTKVTVTCEGFTAEQPIIVSQKPPNVVNMALKSAPKKSQYVVGEKLDLSGLSVTFEMDDQSTADIPFSEFSDRSITTNPLNDSVLTIDQKEVVVAYQDLSVSVPIEVKAQPVIPPDNPDSDLVMFPDDVLSNFAGNVSENIGNVFNIALIIFFMILSVFLLSHIIRNFIL